MRGLLIVMTGGRTNEATETLTKPKQEELQMTTFDEVRVREYYATWSTGDPDKVIEFFANEAVFEDLAFEAKFEGLDAIRSFAVLTYNGVPTVGA